MISLIIKNLKENANTYKNGAVKKVSNYKNKLGIKKDARREQNRKGDM